MKKIIFICKGNQFRSQIAKALYNKYKKDDSLAESYGITVEEENNSGRKIATFSSLGTIIKSLKMKEGIDYSQEVCKQFTPEIINSADKVIFMDIDQVPKEYNNKDYVYWRVKDFKNDGSTTQKMIEDKIDEIQKLVLELINQ